jgi:hypothetical protein
MCIWSLTGAFRMAGGLRPAGLFRRGEPGPLAGENDRKRYWEAFLTALEEGKEAGHHA